MAEAPAALSVGRVRACRLNLFAESRNIIE